MWRHWEGLNQQNNTGWGATEPLAPHAGMGLVKCHLHAAWSPCSHNRKQATCNGSLTPLPCDRDSGAWVMQVQCCALCLHPTPRDLTLWHPCKPVPNATLLVLYFSFMLPKAALRTTHQPPPWRDVSVLHSHHIEVCHNEGLLYYTA